VAIAKVPAITDAIRTRFMMFTPEQTRSLCTP
jgi:hypothetical protein